jgi:hypothetical protein
MYWFGFGPQGVAKDEKRAIALYKRACVGGEMIYGCANLGRTYYHGKDVATDEKIAVELKTRCDVGDMFSCFLIGVIYSVGKGVAEDHKRAAALFKKACDGGESQGCVNLGVMYWSEVGWAKDAKRAAKLFKMACDGGNMRGCHFAAKLAK